MRSIFIWNGINYKLVQDTEFERKHPRHKYYGYVVVRRLYVSDLKPFQNKNYLYKRFKKYGEIESIKILKSGNEAYLTYVYDLAAYLAFNEEKEIRTELAEPWHQPETIIEAADDNLDNQMELDEQSTPPIHKLNDDCLFMIFANPWHYPKPATPSILELPDECLFMTYDHCSEDDLINLSETCVRFDYLLKTKYLFPNVYKRLEICSDRPTFTYFHKQARLMNRHVLRLDVFLPELEGIVDNTLNEISSLGSFGIELQSL